MTSSYTKECVFNPLVLTRLAQNSSTKIVFSLKKSFGISGLMLTGFQPLKSDGLLVTFCLSPFWDVWLAGTDDLRRYDGDKCRGFVFGFVFFDFCRFCLPGTLYLSLVASGCVLSHLPFFFRLCAHAYWCWFLSFFCNVYVHSWRRNLRNIILSFRFFDVK